MLNSLEMSHMPVMVATTTKVLPGLRYERNYFITIGGALKILQVCLGLCGFLCISAVGPSAESPASWYLCVCLTSFWSALVTALLYAFHVIEMLHYVPWLVVELCFSSSWSLLYLAVGGFFTAHHAGETAGSAWTAAGVVAFLGMSAHAWEAALKFQLWRRGEIAQGERTVATSNDAYVKY